MNEPHIALTQENDVVIVLGGERHDAEGVWAISGGETHDVTDEFYSIVEELDKRGKERQLRG